MYICCTPRGLAQDDAIRKKDRVPSIFTNSAHLSPAAQNMHSKE